MTECVSSRVVPGKKDFWDARAYEKDNKCRGGEQERR